MKKLYAKYVYPNNGYDSDIEQCKKFLVLNQYYLVDSIDMGGSFTYLILTEMKELVFNSVNFKFYFREEDDFIPHDIYKDIFYNPRLSRNTLKKNE